MNTFMNDDVDNNVLRQEPLDDVAHDVPNEKWHQKAVIGMSLAISFLLLVTVLLVNNYQTYMSSASEDDRSDFIYPTLTSTPFPTTDPCATPIPSISHILVTRHPWPPEITLEHRPTATPTPRGTRIVSLIPTQGQIAPWPTSTPVSPTLIPSMPVSTAPCP